MACQDQDVAFQVVLAQSLPWGRPPTHPLHSLTFIRSVQELRILRRAGKEADNCSVAL